MLFGIVVALGRRQRLGPMAAVLVGGVVVAVIQSTHAGHWAVATVLVFGSAATVLCPAADSAISRSELAADQYAAMAGVGADLTSASRILGTNGPRQQRMASRLLSRHPATARRIRALASSPGTATNRREKHPAQSRRLGSAKDPIFSDHVAGQTEHHGRTSRLLRRRDDIHVQEPRTVCPTGPELKEE
jgi:hypothetical protein